MRSEATMDALDDVVALTECAQGRLSIFCESPSARANLVCKSEPFELPHASDLDCLQVIAFLIPVGPQVDGAPVGCSFPRERPIEWRPTLGPDLLGQGSPYLLLRARAELARHQPLGLRPHSVPNIIARNDEVLTVIGATADNDVDMRVLRIPVVDSHPVEPGPEVTLRLRHQVPGKGLEIRQLGRVVRRYDEPEMMPVALAPRCEGTMVGVIPLGIEHATGGPVFGYALTPQIGQMSTERSSAHPVPHHARLYNHSA
jgi:hypothetical protein